MKAQELEAAALELEPDARARLARRLLESLEALSEQEVERLWVEEAKRRDRDADANGTVGRDFDLVMQEADARLG